MVHARHRPSQLIVNYRRIATVSLSLVPLFASVLGLNARANKKMTRADEYRGAITQGRWLLVLWGGWGVDPPFAVGGAASG